MFVEAFAPIAEENGRLVPAAHVNAPDRAVEACKLPVDKERYLIGCRIGGKLHAHDIVLGGDDGTSMERVGRKRYDDEPTEVGCDERPACRQRIGGRSGGCCDDKAVSAHIGDVRVRDVEREVDDVSVRASRDGDLVECEERGGSCGLASAGLVFRRRACIVVPGVGIALTHNVNAEVAAPFLHNLTDKRCGDDRDHALIACVRQKAESAEVDAEHGYSAPLRLAHRAQDGSVATERYGQVDACGAAGGDLRVLFQAAEIDGVDERMGEVLGGKVGRQHERCFDRFCVGVIAHDKDVHEAPDFGFAMMGRIIAKLIRPDVQAISDPEKAAPMSDKLSRARHIRRSAVAGKGPDPSGSASEASAHSSSDTVAAVGSSAALMGVCTIISRLTGFVRTWAMAFALGATAISSSYQVANNLPNMLYELVVGGMIVTAFLPVYVSVKRRLGVRAGNEYASNLLTIVVAFLGVLSALCIAFPAVAIYTQSFFSDQGEMGTATFFFQFFAIQLVFYGASAIVSGLLNANRDYLWSAIAPVANNLVVIATFFAYAVISPEHPTEALYVIAIGNPLGVFVQLAIQLPALAKNGIRVRPRVNFRDPALRETLAIGVPAVFVMATSFVIVSVQNAAALVFLDAGPSVLAYARLWFTLPYSFLAVPITTAMFTELSEMQSDGDGEGVKRGIVSGTNQILFFMIPFSFYLVVFSLPLVTLYHAGAFSLDSVSVIASYLSVYALALPFYGVNTYLQKIFSSLRKMKVFAGFNLIGALFQIGLTLAAALLATRGVPISAIAAAEIAFYLVADLCLFVYLRRTLGAFGLRSTTRAFLAALALGALGAAAGAGVLFALETFFGALSGSILQAFLYVVAGGVVSLIVTFGLALVLRVPEAAFLRSIARRLFDR